MLAICESKWGLKGNMIYSNEPGEQLPGREEYREGDGGESNEIRIAPI